ncbi:MAG: hypothetical protein CMO74_09325 [Verrucomicrobiales bacterium]|nr:hypothetical protein [Verrucomicrobiales bacterium]
MTRFHLPASKILVPLASVTWMAPSLARASLPCRVWPSRSTTESAAASQASANPPIVAKVCFMPPRGAWGESNATLFARKFPFASAMARLYKEPMTHWMLVTLSLALISLAIVSGCDQRRPPSRGGYTAPPPSPTTIPAPATPATPTNAAPVVAETNNVAVAPTAPAETNAAPVASAPAEPDYPALAVAELQQLIDKGNAKASWVLGLKHELGSGVETNTVKAYELVALAVARSEGIERSMILKDRARLASMLTSVQVEEAGQAAKKLFEDQMKALRDQADEGDSATQYALGLRFFVGDDLVPRNRSEAAKWLELSAKQGHVGAAALLGHLYMAGDGVGRDPVEGLRLLHAASSPGGGLAQAGMNEAANSLPAGQLAEAHPRARNLIKNKIVLLKDAAARGDDMAKFRLGLMLYLGKDLPKNLAGAAEWFEKAAEQGNSEAPALLAGMYFTGQGVKQDNAAAYRWHGIAKARGNASAGNNQNEVAKLLEAEEKKTADTAITNWLKAHPKK